MLQTRVLWWIVLVGWIRASFSTNTPIHPHPPRWFRSIILIRKFWNTLFLRDACKSCHHIDTPKLCVWVEGKTHHGIVLNTSPIKACDDDQILDPREDPYSNIRSLSRQLVGSLIWHTKRDDEEFSSLFPSLLCGRPGYGWSAKKNIRNGHNWGAVAKIPH